MQERLSRTTTIQDNLTDTWLKEARAKKASYLVVVQDRKLNNPPHAYATDAEGRDTLKNQYRDSGFDVVDLRNPWQQFKDVVLVPAIRLLTLRGH